MRLRTKPKFPGKFFSWKATINDNWNKKVQEFFLVFSSGKREATLRHLWLKFVWNNLSKDEFLVFILTLKDGDDKKWSFIKAAQKIPRSLLRKRLIAMETYLKERTSNKESYLGSRRIRIEIQRGIRKLPDVPKYSGYVRSIASIGKNKPRGLDLTIEELMEDGIMYEERIDWYTFFTVGEFSPLPEMFPPDER